VAGCNSSTPTTTTPTTPSLITETLQPAPAPLNPNGARTFPFAVSVAGTVTITLQSIAPDASVRVGFALGTWNGTACTTSVSNDSATTGTQLGGNISAAGNLCARVYDVGNLVRNQSITVQATHP
jgi:hypothetical protein